MFNFYLILIASLCVTSCSILGVFLVLQKLAMLTDAISHAILPGLVIACLINGTKSSFYMILAGCVCGITISFIIRYLSSKLSIQSDASITINFTWMFALGVIIISYYGRKIDFDPDCIIYGDILYAPLDLIITKNGTNMGPKAIFMLLFILILNGTFVITCYKELKIICFDPLFAKTIGIKIDLYHYILMGLSSITAVGSLDIVGVVLNLSFIVVPASTAYIITENLKKMILLSIFIGIINVIVGFYLAVWLNVSMAGSITTVSSIIFIIFYLVSLLSNKRCKILTKCI